MNFSQPNHRRILFILILAAGLGWIWASALPAGATTSGKIPAPQAGFLAPDFNLATLDGQEIRLIDLRGQVVLVNIWASWCPPCRAEMPAIQSAYETYKDQGFVVLAVNSTIQDTIPDVQKFVEEYKLSFPILLDIDGSATRAYQVQSLPTSFFVGKDGTIREVVVGGPMAEALLRSRIQKLLEE